jgi:hypothetical protein
MGAGESSFEVSWTLLTGLPDNDEGAGSMLELTAITKGR